MKKSEVKICIYRDENQEEKMKVIFQNIILNVSKLLELYKQTTGQELNPAEFENFMKKPVEFTTKKLQDKVVIPEGFDRNEYLKLIKLPDLTMFEMYLNYVDPTDHYKTNYCSLPFLKYDAEGLTLSETAEQMIYQNNIYLSEQDNEVFIKMQDFIDLANELNTINGNFNNIFNKQYQHFINLPTHPEYKYSLNLQNFINFIR